MSETMMLTSNPYRRRRRRAARRHGGLPAAGRAAAGARRRRASPARRRDRRHRGQGPERLRRLLAHAREDEGGVHAPTAGSRPATSAGSTRSGYVTIVGRSKDLIISGGYNVYPAEIEGFINEMPGVAESAVIGVPHPDFGEAVVAVVVARPGATLDERALIAALKAQHRQLQGAQARLRRRPSCRATRWARCRRTCCASSTRGSSLAEPPTRSARETAQRRRLALAPSLHDCIGASVRRETASAALGTAAH